MFNTKILSLVTFLVSVLIVTPLIAQDFSNSKGTKKERVTYKCFVEYSGGKGFDIRHVTGNFHKAKQASQFLFSYSNRKGAVMDKKVVHKVYECVKGNERFINGKANSLDKVLPR